MCRPGTETPGLASPECIVCPKGTKSEFNELGYQECLNCKINEYQSTEGSTVCEKCRCGKVSAIRSANCKEPVARDALAQIDPPTSVTQFGPRSIRVTFNPLKNIYNGRLLYYQLEWTSIIRDGVPDFSTTCAGSSIRISKFCEVEIVPNTKGVKKYFDIDCPILDEEKLLENPAHRDKCSLRNSYDYEEFLQYGRVPSNSPYTLEEILDLPDPVAIKTINGLQDCVSAIEVGHFLHHKHFFFRLVGVIQWLDVTDMKTYIVRAESDAYSVLENFRWVVRSDCVDFDEYLETRDVAGPAGCVERGMMPNCVWKEKVDPFEWTCVRCPYGADCRNKPAWFNVKGLFGFWRNKNFTGMTRFHRCPVPQGCLGANNPAFVDLFIMNGTQAEGEVNMATVNWEERCHSEMGYEGIACAICKKGVFYMTASGCKTCEGKSGGSIAVTIGVLVVGMSAVGYFVYKFRSLAVIAKDVQKVSKLLINFLQVMTSIKAVYTLEIPSMNIGFSMTAYFEVFSFDFVAIFGFPCLYEMTYFEKYVADMIMLFGFGLFVLVLYICGLAFLAFKGKKKKRG
jgi:hypothetical protein